ncbi:hypothetical protein CXG81DRAFT_24303 [Caulochytrium protostelioides]|uniref:Uncharacterized protein n=1 Tax=Caulochytrium protostelioides TaxID=1555241 RepID=A0A4P9XCD6_9FUNG|nr:hypothetical protein CXG81DRAFT_24303 [Caulochytrium protostelioides]|eukprot:RKP03098.1 hypothetical protein CXG81DRAFT_24303 [Caulochytrium protostelioides]
MATPVAWMLPAWQPLAPSSDSAAAGGGRPSLFGGIDPTTSGHVASQSQRTALALRTAFLRDASYRLMTHPALSRSLHDRSRACAELQHRHTMAGRRGRVLPTHLASMRECRQACQACGQLYIPALTAEVRGAKQPLGPPIYYQRWDCFACRTTNVYPLFATETPPPPPPPTFSASASASASPAKAKTKLAALQGLMKKNAQKDKRKKEEAKTGFSLKDMISDF